MTLDEKADGPIKDILREIREASEAEQARITSKCCFVWRK